MGKEHMLVRRDKFILHWKNVIEDKKKQLKIRNTHNRHDLPSLKVYELCSASLKINSYFDEEEFKNLSHSRVLEELKVLIMDAFDCTTKVIATNAAQVEENDSTQFLKSASSNHNQRKTEHLPKKEDSK